MSFRKNKLLILILLVTCAWSLGGFGVSGLSTYGMTTCREDYEQNGATDLRLESCSIENAIELGFSPFIYFDALPYDLAIQYNREIKYTALDSYLQLGAGLGSDYEFETTDFESAVLRISDYFTIRKEIIGLSIPMLAKAALYIGGGINYHNTVFPSIALLKDITDMNDLDNIYNAFNGSIDSSQLIDALENHGIESNGIHVQTGIQGKVFTLNIFANAKYTIILNDDDNSIKESFPGLDIGLALGI